MIPDEPTDEQVQRLVDACPQAAPIFDAVRIVAWALCPGNIWAFDQYEDSPEDVARIAIDALLAVGLLTGEKVIATDSAESAEVP